MTSRSPSWTVGERVHTRLRRSCGLWFPSILQPARSETRSRVFCDGCWAPAKGRPLHSGIYCSRRTSSARKRTPSRGFTDWRPHPGDRRRRRRCPRWFSRQQHYKEAADCYRKALSIEPNIREIQLNLGLAEFKLGDFQAALAPLAAVLAIDPQSLQARTLLGMRYYGAGMYAKALPELDRALAADPKNTQLHHVIAQSCLWSGQHQRALKEFEWLLREQPDSAATHMLMGEALDGLGRDPDAIVEFQAAAAASSAEPDVHFGLGYLFWKQRRYDEAEREFRRCFQKR